MQEVYGDETQLDSIKNAENNENSIGDKDTQLRRESLTPRELNETPAIDYKVQYGIASNLSDSNGWKTGAGQIIDVQFTEVNNNNEIHVFKGGEKVRLTISALVHKDFDAPIIGFLVKDRLGQVLFGENTLPFTSDKPVLVKAGDKIAASYDFTLPMLPNGEYSMMISLANGDINNHVQHHWLHDAMIINVFQAMFGGVWLE